MTMAIPSDKDKLRERTKQKEAAKREMRKTLENNTNDNH